MKVVIVDDNESIRKLLRALCEGEGHEVVAEFGSGEGLLDCIASHQPDVVCLDYELPGENGLQLLVHMEVTANQVDVVMITGSDDPELKGHAADLGAAGFINKPFKPSQVIDELKAIEQTRAIAARAATSGSSTVTAASPVPVLAESASPGEDVRQEADQAPTSVVARTAVIVDDSGSVRLLLKGILDEIGIKVLGSAATGRDGIEVVKRTRPALVCLDIDMPGMTGLEALPLIRAASPNTKVVMITGNAGRQVVEASVAGGAKGYFLKPIRPAKVEDFIRKLLGL